MAILVMNVYKCWQGSVLDSVQYRMMITVGYIIFRKCSKYRKKT